MNLARLEFTLATASDATDIFDLVYRHPDPFLRAASQQDIENWIAHGACWIIRYLNGSRIVGACNIKVPETSPGQRPEPAEFGGIFLHPDFRVRGISDALGVLALATYYWDNDPDSPQPIPIISHVHVDNKNPLKLLERLGFVFDKIIPVPDGVLGFEHMPRDEEGRLRGKEFRFPRERRIYLFREMAKLLSTEQLERYAINVLPALGMSPTELDLLAKKIESQQEGSGH